MVDSTIFKQAFICNKCFKVYPVDVKFNLRLLDNDKYRIILRNTTMEKICETCNRVTIHYMVDSEIANIVRLFNLIGYKTVYSCQGHVYRCKNGKYSISDAYVFIKGNKKPSKKLIKGLLKINWDSFSVGQCKTFKPKIDFNKEEDVNLLLNSTTFAIHYNLKKMFSFTSDSALEAEEYLTLQRNNLFDLLSKYYNDMKKRRKK